MACLRSPMQRDVFVMRPTASAAAGLRSMLALRSCSHQWQLLKRYTGFQYIPHNLAPEMGIAAVEHGYRDGKAGSVWSPCYYPVSVREMWHTFSLHHAKRTWRARGVHGEETEARNITSGYRLQRARVPRKLYCQYSMAARSRLSQSGSGDSTIKLRWIRRTRTFSP